jgi:hypothetical protein
MDLLSTLTDILLLHLLRLQVLQKPQSLSMTVPTWVAKVLEVRAKDEQHVYPRLFWLY